MKIKKVLSITLKLFAVCIAMTISFAVAAGIANPGAASNTQSPEEAAQAGMALLIVSAVNALLLAWPIARSRWHGLKLVGAILFVLFSVQTFMSQVETIFFGSAFNISATEMRGIILTGFLTAVFFSFLAVLIMGKMRKPKDEEEPAPSLDLSPRDWAMRLILLPLAYIAFYFLFGYFVAWQSPDVRQLYSGSTDIAPFFAHMANTLQNSLEIIPFQFVRGLIWIGLAFPILRLMKGGAWEKAIVVGFLFGLLLTTQLLFPNPYMPAPVRLAHFIETSTSTFLYGVLIGKVFAPQGNK
ncbi:MAG: hypothetical protein WBL25_19175 [Anaerolineales bacterium]